MFLLEALLIKTTNKMGSEISSFVVEPLVGIGIITLGIFAIIKQRAGENTKAKWFAMGAIASIILLIALNIILGIVL